MSFSVRQIVGAGILAAAAAATVTTPNLVQHAFAAEPTAKSLLDSLSVGRVFDPSKLVRFGDDFYSVNVEPGVSGQVTEEHVIRKIGMGRTSFVHIVTTPTGTYSSDGLASPYIRYPGIEVEQLGKAPYWMGGLLGWSNGQGWVPIPMVDAHSFSVWSVGPGEAVHTTNHGSCVYSKGVRVCV